MFLIELVDNFNSEKKNVKTAKKLQERIKKYKKMRNKWLRKRDLLAKKLQVFFFKKRT